MSDRPEHACHVDDCGRSCPTCGERITCMGLDPVTVACSAHNDECSECNGENPCRDCASIRRMTAVAQAAWDDATEPPRLTPAEEWAGYWGERRAEDRAYEDARLRDREEERRAG